MSVLAKLQEDMKAAMKSGQKERLQVIRMLISDVKNIDLAPKKLTEEETIAAYAKKLRKGAEEYEKLGKTAEVAQFKAELAIVEEYLPKRPPPRTPTSSSRPSSPRTPSPKNRWARPWDNS